jgi:hypothetical protein
MDGYLKQSTASQTRWIGPFVDDTDFKTAETGLTVANTDIKVSKNGGSSASKNSGGGTHDVNGKYAVTWDATDTATVGPFSYSVKVAGALQVWGDYIVVEEAVYDQLFAASALGYIANAPVNVAQFGGSNLTAASGIPEVKVASIAANAITATAINADAITAAKIADGAIDAATFAASAITATAIAADAITAAKIADGAIDAATFAAGAITAAAIATDAIGAAELAAGAVDKIVDQAWDELLSGHAGVGSTGAALSAAGGSGDPWSTALPGAYGSGTAGKIIGDNINATISSRANQTSLDTLDDYVDTEVAAIKAKTDQLVFTVANQIDANVLDWKSATAPAMTGDAYARLGAPAGASAAADIAAIQAKTTNLPASPAAVGSAMTLTSGERTSVADALLDRDMATGTDSGSSTVRTVRQALRFLRNKWGIAAGTLSVKKEDDSTDSWTASVTQTAGNPVSTIDPAGP